MNCPYCKEAMTQEVERMGWLCEQCWTFWDAQTLKNIQLGRQMERICKSCQYTFHVMPDESVNKCPACRSTRIALVHPEAFEWDAALVAACKH